MFITTWTKFAENLKFKKLFLPGYRNNSKSEQHGEDSQKR